MKEFIKRWLLVFAMVVISVFMIGSIRSGQWENTLFILELLITTLAICLLQLLTNRIPMRIHLLKYLVDLGMVISTVLLLGWLWKWWYTPKGVWFIFVAVIPVFIAAIILDVVKVRRDVDIINKQIKHRRQKLQEEEKS
ncbi:MAG TPA: hypothetical protein VN441_05260 [Syntrophomonas sp.]|nr:hypothetical protein [Syntrophomonas sp.]